MPDITSMRVVTMPGLTWITLLLILISPISGKSPASSITMWGGGGGHHSGSYQGRVYICKGLAIRMSLLEVSCICSMDLGPKLAGSVAP